MDPLFAIDVAPNSYNLIQPLRLQSEIITSTQLIYKVIERFSGDYRHVPMRSEFYDFIEILRDSYKSEAGVLFEPNCSIEGSREIEHWYVKYKRENPESKSMLILQRAPGTLGNFQCLHVCELETGPDDAPKAVIAVRRENQIFSIDEVVSLRAAGRIVTSYCHRLYSQPISIEVKLKCIIEQGPPTIWLLKTVIFVSPEVLICLNTEGSIIIASKVAVELFGNNVTDETDGLSWLGNLVHPDDLKSVVSQFKQVINTINYHALDTRMFNKSGAVKSFHITLKPILKEGTNEVLWWIVEVVDKSLLSSRSPIPRLIFAEMAHEIRTPLSCIIGTSSLLDFTHLSSEQKELTHTIKTCGQQLFNLINGILDITRLDYSKMLLEYNNVSLERVLYEATDMVYSEMVLKNLQIIVDVHESSPERIIVDEQRLRQIIGNLLANAVRYSRTNGTIMVTCRKDSEDYEQKLMTLKFSVEDNGVGIPEEEAGTLFRAFSQSSNQPPGDENKSGTGLGLTICKKLVNLMGGEIWFESEVGEGSKFFFTVKLSSDLSAYPQKPESFVTSKAALRSLKEYLNSLRGSHEIRMFFCIKNDTMRNYLSSKLSQLELYLSVIRVDELKPNSLKADTKPNVFSTLISDESKDEALQKLTEAIPGLGIIQITVNSERCNEKVRGGSIAHIRIPIRLSVFYRTIQEVLLMVIYNQAINIVTTETSNLSVASSSAPPAISTPMPQYTPIEEPERIAERFPMSILVVDDDNISQMMFIKFLSKFGYEAKVYNAADGSEAVSKVIQFAQMESPLDLIFMDIQMPYLDGIEATRRIRKWCHENNAFQPHILALTAGALDQSGDVEYFDAGMCGVLTKPVQFNRLDLTLRESYECVHNMRSCACSQ